MNTASCIERSYRPSLELLRSSTSEDANREAWAPLEAHFDAALACESYPAFRSYFKRYREEMIELLFATPELTEEEDEQAQNTPCLEDLLRQMGVTEARVRLVEQGDVLSDEASIILDEDLDDVPEKLRSRVGLRVHVARTAMWDVTFARCCLWRALITEQKPDALGLRFAVTLACDAGRDAYGQAAAAVAELDATDADAA